ncbi:P-loop containing nucleoside triphosphate hydrolase protein [Paxillus ammoniavirescens]|nr:P-loop containing nucleoside triphosphate hydrolase protein [Paxillus ammoniavirescens]
MLWEVVGESAAGKTQLALQLSLFVQLPPEVGGVLGSACYITVASHLQTTRMEQILNAHPLLSPSLCSFSNVKTVQTPTIEKLVHILSTSLPQYINTTSENTSSKPLKLLVIDALTELFHSLGKTTTKTLVERSRRISEISTLLHILASKYRLAVLVLNEVIDVIDREPSTGGPGVSYRDQSKWFGRPDSIPGDNRKEAALGLVWANQVNARIFLTRTGRRRCLVKSEIPHKRSMTQDGIATTQMTVAPIDDQLVLIRRLSVVFSSVSAPISCDYIVAEEGLSVIPRSTVSLVSSHSTSMHPPPAPSSVLMGVQDPSMTSSTVAKGKQRVQVAPLDVGCVADTFAAECRPLTPENEAEPADGDDEWNAFWAQNSLPDDAYSQIDLPCTSNT